MCLRVSFKKMFDRRPTWASLERPIIWSHGRSATEARGCLRLELLNICSSSKKQKQTCNARTITSEKQFSH